MIPWGMTVMVASWKRRFQTCDIHASTQLLGFWVFGFLISCIRSIGIPMGCSFITAFCLRLGWRPVFLDFGGVNINKDSKYTLHYLTGLAVSIRLVMLYTANKGSYAILFFLFL
jgi:hypothetical protein